LLLLIVLIVLIVLVVLVDRRLTGKFSDLLPATWRCHMADARGS